MVNRGICAIGSSCGVPSIAHNDQTGKASLVELMREEVMAEKGAGGGGGGRGRYPEED